MPVPQAWQLRNLLLRDAAFQVLCSNGDGSTEACHELKVAAVWSIQEHLLASYGLAEVTASLPMALALDDFCQAYPLDKMQTLDAVERSFQVIGAIQTYLWAYVETLQNILQCDVSVVCAQLRQNCSLCRERSGRRDFELQLRGGSITLSSNAIVSTAPATSSPHEKKVPVDDVAPHRPPAMDREALHIALLAAKTLQQDYDHVNSDSITEAFSEPFDPVADPAERLSQIHNISMGVNGLTVAEHRHSSATMHTTELVPDDGVTVSLKGLPAPVDSTAHAARQGLTHATTASCAASCRAGEEAGSCTTSRSCLNRDTMMHPTKRWTEKCDRLSRIYSEVLKEARRPSHSVDRGSPFVNEGSGEKRFAALLQEVDDLQLFGNVYPDLGS
ncbi:unnamed protein product [Symbiodinium microadriaticum]|nr:unnamed protein product [Symbiodinium microadriaticum]